MGKRRAPGLTLREPPGVWGARPGSSLPVTLVFPDRPPHPHQPNSKLQPPAAPQRRPPSLNLPGGPSDPDSPQTSAP